MKQFKKIGILLAFFVSFTVVNANPTDSIGTKVKNGKIFIMHKVEKAQGLFSISRRYNVPLNDIIEANPGSDKSLQVDQILLIPTGKDAPKEEQKVKEYFQSDKQPAATGSETSAKTTFAKYHTVMQGETLYSVSVLYKTKVDILKSLNNLQSETLTVGQQLVVPSTEEEKKSFDDKMVQAEKKIDDAVAKTNQLQKATNTQTNTKSNAKEISNSKTSTYEIKVEPMPKYNIEKVVETGVNEELKMDLSSSTNKRVCSHHAASVGSTIMITNPANNKSVFVKVVSNHSLNADKGNIILLPENVLSELGLEVGGKVETSFAR
ncbi:MAG: LysM peptidoglycan-binding domain-containing protein [Flavobacteriales bacterium]|nr:LysM peptidoglycan-binding domain-containing protein [Flavobacteriales bacterium]